PPNQTRHLTGAASRLFAVQRLTGGPGRGAWSLERRTGRWLMAQKHVLTLFHCLMAAVVTPAGLAWAGQVADRQPVAALLAGLGAVILPVLIATRVAWASGYDAGRRDSPGTAAQPSNKALQPTGPPSLVSQRIKSARRPGG